MEAVGQQRQEQIAGVLLQHAGLVSRIGPGIGGVKAEDDSFGLQGTSEMASSVTQAGGDQNGIDLWIGEDFFNIVNGTDNCTGTTLAPGASCTVGVRFTNVAAPRGPNRTGTIRFTDSATGSPQTGNLIGIATP